MNRILFFITITCAIFGTSCLKDEPINDFSNLQPIVVVPDGNWPSFQFPLPHVLNAAKPVDTVLIYARVSWGKPLDKDIKVVFTRDTAIITEFNAFAGTSYTFLNNEAYQMTSLELTIPAGEMQATLPIMVFPAAVDVSKSNMLGFTIRSVSDGIILADNLKSIIKPIKVQ